MRMFTSLLIIVLLAVTAYNFRQISALRSDIDSLRTQVSVLKSRMPAPNGRSSGRLTLTERVQSHVDRAKRLALKGDIRGARAEISKGLETLQKAGRDAGGPSLKAFDEAQRKINDTRSSIERLWRQLDSGSDRTKGG